MKILIIDGNSIVNRAFYGIRLLSNKNGVFTNAIIGFFNIYIKLLKKFNPECVAVAFDLRAPTFRKQKYEAYKSTRKGMPEELASQMPYIKEILNYLGVKVLECAGYEADDIIGTLSHTADVNKNACVISTGDRDAFQLITENVSVNLAKNSEDILYTPEIIRAHYGISPKQMIEVKALMGDACDNIPGVDGIGEKTALTLIQKYDNVDYIYKNLNALEITASVKKKLETGREKCYLSRELGTIVFTAPVPTDINYYFVGESDNKSLLKIFDQLEMSGMVRKLNLRGEC